MTTATTPKPAQPKCALLVMCVECGAGAEVPLPTSRDAVAYLLASKGWFTSVLSPPGQGPEVPILIGALCATCAPTVFPPEVLLVAEARRKKMIEET